MNHTPGRIGELCHMAVKEGSVWSENPVREEPLFVRWTGSPPLPSFTVCACPGEAAQPETVLWFALLRASVRSIIRNLPVKLLDS